MENPPQSSYTVEQLFSLKPEIISPPVSKQQSADVSKVFNNGSNLVQSGTSVPGFWTVNKIYFFIRTIRFFIFWA